jgi:hypothetical protein
MTCEVRESIKGWSREFRGASSAGPAQPLSKPSLGHCDKRMVEVDLHGRPATGSQSHVRESQGAEAESIEEHGKREDT